MTELERFWTSADAFGASHRIVIDRPRGTAHPRHPDVIYPLDYGFLAETTAVDGDGIDCWRGSLPTERVTGVIVTVDVFQDDSEIKWLVGCTPDEMGQALDTHRTAWQAAMLITRQTP